MVNPTPLPPLRPPTKKKNKKKKKNVVPTDVESTIVYLTTA